MKTAGIIGGIAPESTIDYYRRIVALYRATAGDGSYPSIIINSIDLKRMLSMIGEPERLTDYLSAEVERLANAGASFALFSSNTPHIVFDALRKRSRIPMLSIVEAARDEAVRIGIKRTGLIGTRFTMQGGFYPKVFSQAGIEVVLPSDDEQAYIHEKYMGELVNAVFLEDTRKNLLAIIDRLRDRDHVGAVILGGTELPLILRDASSSGISFLDTTKIHTEAVVREILQV